MMNITLAEAKQREDYSFDCNILYGYINEIRANKFSDHDPENGEHIWGVAVMEIGCVDIELNLSNSQDGVNDVVPDYFICAKDKCGNWIPAGYIDDPVDVYFGLDDWKEDLEADMFNKLIAVVEKYGLDFDSSDKTEEEVFNLFD